MENLFTRFVFLSSFFYMGLMVGVSASKETSGESYWQATLPETPIPTAVQELLHPENWNWREGKSRYAGISKDVLNTNTITVSPDVYAKAFTGAIPIEKDVATFFLEKDLHSRQKMTLHFPERTKTPHLLPRQVADSIPFSSSKLPQIQTRFALIPKSAESEIVKQTIQDCEEPSIEGEDKLCATSLESLVDFSVSKLGKNVEVYSTKVEKENKQEYNIAGGVRKIGDKSVVCHQQNYLYAVFYCHEVHATRAYMVSLVGADGSKAEAVAVCHTDSRKWKAKHLAFQLLNVKPGTVPICHFLNSGTLLWVPKLEKV